MNRRPARGEAADGVPRRAGAARDRHVRRVAIDVVHRALDVGGLQPVEDAQRGVVQTRHEPRAWPVRICDRSSSYNLSRSQCNRISMLQCPRAHAPIWTGLACSGERSVTPATSFVRGWEPPKAVTPKYGAQVRPGEIVIQAGRRAHRAPLDSPRAPIDRVGPRRKNSASSRAAHASWTRGGFAPTAITSCMCSSSTRWIMAVLVCSASVVTKFPVMSKGAQHVAQPSKLLGFVVRGNLTEDLACALDHPRQQMDGAHPRPAGRAPQAVPSTARTSPRGAFRWSATRGGSHRRGRGRPAVRHGAGWVRSAPGTCRRSRVSWSQEFRQALKSLRQHTRHR